MQQFESSMNTRKKSKEILFAITAILTKISHYYTVKTIMCTKKDEGRGIAGIDEYIDSTVWKLDEYTKEEQRKTYGSNNNNAQ